MDSSFTIKPSPGVAKGRALRDPVPVREAVDTELVGAKTVTAAGDGGGKDGGPKHEGAQDGDQRPDHALHDLVADPNSRDVIYRERDIRAVEREHPDQALLRQRAYHRQVPAEADVPPSDDPHADIKA
jgi:hypothetical protein